MIFNEITNFFDKNKYKIYFVLFIFSILFLFLYLDSCNKRNSDNEKNRQNIAALTDTVKVERDKNGQLQYSIATFADDFNDLKNYNEKLYKEYTALKGDVSSLVNMTLGLRKEFNDNNGKIFSKLNDLSNFEEYTTKVDSSGNLIKLDSVDFSFKNPSSEIGLKYSFDGYTKILSSANFEKKEIVLSAYDSYLKKFELELEMTTAIVFNKDRQVWEAIAKAKNQDIKIKQISAAINPELHLNNQNKYFNLSISSGVGATAFNPYFIPFIGITAGITILEF